MIAHDLRNPLQGITNSIYCIKKNYEPQMNAEGCEMIKNIENCITGSNKILNDLLEYSKELRIETTETNPKALLKGALSQVAIPASVEIIDKTQFQPLIKVDKEKIERVFINLIKNAFEAMPNGGRLTITSEKRRGKMVFYFADTGIGMSEEILNKLWTPLFTTKAKGMGFGTAICRRIVDAHDGKITVKSAIGKGSTFKVSLPLELQPVQKEPQIHFWTPKLEQKANSII
jgi:signal transduction histidine kinase